MTIAVLNTKGGASKSTVALQVAAAYFLQKKENVDLYEFDDENRDSLNFNLSEIRSKQIKIGDGKEITDILRNSILKYNGDNLVIDVGGNKTTTIFVNGLKKSMLYKKIDLIIIPMSGGTQDLNNAIKTYELVKAFNIPIVFGLSRVRNVKRVQYQYYRFFIEFPNEKYFILQESDVIDLSRDINKSIYEVASDKELKSLIEKDLNEAFSTGNDAKADLLSHRYEIYDDSEEYLENILTPAWNVLDNIITKDPK